MQFADLLEADDLRPEFVRLVDVANIEDEMIDAGRAHGLGRSLREIGNSIGHHSAPKSRLVHLVLPRDGARKPSEQAAEPNSPNPPTLGQRS